MENILVQQIHFSEAKYLTDESAHSWYDKNSFNWKALSALIVWQ